jgi:branched-chain amino acid transport system ATP-binding protein
MMLQVDGIAAGYNRQQVLEGVSFRLAEGDFAVVVGHNGAGKTTLLRTIVGAIRPWAGTLRIAAHGPGAVEYVPQENNVFAGMTVADNLRVGVWRLRDSRTAYEEGLRRVFELFPALESRLDHMAGTLSGGQKQMVALSRALMAKPRLLLVDEPSTGLAPRLVGEVLDTLTRINREQSTTVLLVEQNIKMAVRYAERVLVMRQGRLIHQAPASQYRNVDVRELLKMV